MQEIRNSAAADGGDPAHPATATAIGAPLELVGDAKGMPDEDVREGDDSLMKRLAVTTGVRFVIHVLIHAKQNVRCRTHLSARACALCPRRLG